MGSRKPETQIGAIVQRFLEETFEGVKIVAVNVRARTDAEGDQVYDIHVIVGPGSRELDPRKLAGLVRRIRPSLEEAGEHGFPVFSFIDQSELGKLKPEFA